jgi:hypothetical protein
MIGAWTTATVTPPPLAAAPSVPGEGIDQIAFLVGGTWVSVPTPGSTSVAEETCTWGPGNRSICTVVVIRSDGQETGHGRGSFNWDAVHQKLLAHSIIEEEGIEQRMVAHEIPLVGSNNQWHFEAEIVIDSLVQQRQMTLTQLGPDEMRVDQSLVEGGELVPLASVRYGRRV